MEYKPTFTSFMSSLLYDLSPAIIAAIVMYFIADSARWIMWVASWIMVAFSLYLLLQTTFVHMRRLYLDEECFRVSSPLSTVEIRWSDVFSAVLRERENVISRTDHFLILQSSRHVIGFNTSTLSKEDEKTVLEVVSRKTPFVIQMDKPAI
jgi:predicted Na+-dependent transporter